MTLSANATAARTALRANGKRCPVRQETLRQQLGLTVVQMIDALNELEASGVRLLRQRSSGPATRLVSIF